MALYKLYIFLSILIILFTFFFFIAKESNSRIQVFDLKREMDSNVFENFYNNLKIPDEYIDFKYSILNLSYPPNWEIEENEIRIVLTNNGYSLQVLTFPADTRIGGALFIDDFASDFINSNILGLDVLIPIINIDNYDNYQFSPHNGVKVQFLEQANDLNISRSLIKMRNGEYVEIIIELPKDLSKGSELDNQIINEVYTIIRSIEYAQ